MTEVPSPSSRRAAGSPWVGPGVVAALLLVVALVATAAGGGKKEEEGGGPRAAPPPAGPAAAAPVRAAAGRLDPEALVAQLFLVDGRDTPVRSADWGAVIGEPGVGRPVRARSGRARAVPSLEVSTELPGQPALGDAGLGEVRRAYRAAGRRARAEGVGLVLGPSADVGVSAGWMSDEVFADEPAGVTPRVRAAVDALRSVGVAAAVGHFPGQGASTQDPLDGPSGVSFPPDGLRDRDLVPFRELVGRVPVVMVSSATYAAFGGATPASTSPEVVQGELRRRLGFEGVAMSDDLEGVAVANGSTIGDAAVASLKAGIDLAWVGDEAEARTARRGVLAAIGSRELPAARVREAALRVLELKRRAGLLD